MSISAISGSGPNPLLETLRQFGQGGANLQKTDLEQMQDIATKVTGREDPGFEALVGAFDKIDGNGHGISLGELKDYAGEGEAKAERAGRPSMRRPHPGGGMSPLLLSGPGGARGAGQAGPAAEGGFSQEDLKALTDLLEEHGIEVPDFLKKAVEDFSSLDQNQDGMASIGELSDFAKAGSGQESGGTTVDGATGSGSEGAAATDATATTDSLAKVGTGPNLRDLLERAKSRALDEQEGGRPPARMPDAYVQRYRQVTSFQVSMTASQSSMTIKA